MAPIDPDFALTFPLIVIDFEATALTLQSYPIEVGLAIASTPHAPVEVWSSLIAPDPTWHMDQQWDRDAERIHGISRWQLREGSAPAKIMQQLNALAGPCGEVWCDGGHYDHHWLETLTVAAAIDPEFLLRDLATILDAQPDGRRRYRQIIDRSPAPHRAGPDAARICAALVSAWSK